MKPTKRNNVRGLKEEWLTFLYDEVLLYCENDKTDFSGYNLTKNPFLKKLQDKENFTICKMDKAIVGQADTFYYTYSSGKIQSFFTHLRNALAHNRIFIENVCDGIIIEDEYQGKLTMYAEITSFEKLKKIITEIKKHYKK